MRTRRTLTIVTFLITLIAAAVSASAQQPQIPTLQVCNQTGVAGKALVKIASRADAVHPGTFTVAIEMKCSSQGEGYPGGSLQIAGINMSDSIIQGTVTATTFEQVTTTGKHTPTVYLNGRCKAGNVQGCRYWMMIADNQKAGQQATPDIISFLIFDGTGKRVAYGTGPVSQGDVDVQATSN